MRKHYTTPSIEVVEIETQLLMLAQSNEQTGTGSGNSNGSGQGTPDLANQRRGSWGDLWD